MKRAIYAGSFDPFTRGHLSVYNKACELFDEVIILFANNPAKKRLTDPVVMSEMVHKATGAKVDITKGLVALYCKKNGITRSVRGLRGTSDYLYEENLAKANQRIYPELDTIYFRADDDGISSTLVRLLYEEGMDVSEYLPEGVVLK